MNKKGATMDNFMVVVQMFGFALFLLIIFVVWSAFSGSDMDTNIWERSSIGTPIKNNAQQAYDQMDWISVVVYFSLHIGIIVLAFALRSHPVVYVIGILLIVILVMVAVPLSNAWEEIIQDNEFTTAVTNIPKLDYIMGKLPIFEMIWGFVTLIALAAFAKSENIW